MRYLFFCFIGLVSFCDAGVRDAQSLPKAGNPPTPTAASVKLRRLAPRYEFGKRAFSQLSVLNDRNIWSTGYDGESLARVRHSKDGGRNWETSRVDPGESKPESLFFIDDQYGWMYGLGKVYRTADGGTNWKHSEIDARLSFSQLAFANRNIGYLSGKHNFEGEERTEIWKTRDGGLTWNRIYVDSQLLNTWDILAASEMVVFVALDQTNLIRSVDGGKTWRRIETNEKSIEGISVGPSNRLWAVGASGTFIQSSDSGDTWHSVVPEDELGLSSWNSICFMSDGSGIAVADHGYIAVSIDGGTTWQAKKSEVDEDLNAVRCGNKSAFVVGSENLYVFTALPD